MSSSNLIPSYKIVLLGDSGVGKSSIASRFVDNTFSRMQDSTIGAAFFSKMFDVDGEACKLDIWDTAGQERYHSLTPMYYRGAKIGLVVFDITKPSSYEKMKQWCEEVTQASKNIMITVVGNKLDLDEKRLISKDDATDFCVMNDYEYIETSAKTGLNVDKIFENSIKRVPPEDDELSEVSTFNIKNNNTIVKRKCC